jgi:tetratricopeptide (TPR) repeat protein
LGLALLPGDGIATADSGGLVRIWEPLAGVAKARELARTGKRSDALSEYDKAIAYRPDDPRLLIERGRLLATLGQSARANSDFENAANLAPDDPQLFLDGGWWAAGPYPLEYHGAEALEKGLATDPSQPAPGIGNQSLKWHEIQPGMLGNVDFEQLFRGDNIIGYAMTVVYSAQSRESVLLIGTDDDGVVWLNGKEVLSTSFSVNDSHALLVTLQPGRNTIVARIRDHLAGHSITLRFGELPLDRARAYAAAKKWKEAAEAFSRAAGNDLDRADSSILATWGQVLAEGGRWKEAIAVFEKIAAREPANVGKQQDLLECYLALHDRASYRRVCEAVIARHGATKDRALANNVIWLTVLMPGAVRNYSAAVDLGHRLMNTGKPDANERNTFGALLYRAGKYEAALIQLKRSIDGQNGRGNAWDWVFTAMARHRARHAGAKEALAKAKELRGESESNWRLRVELNRLLEEAERELTLPPPR